MWFAHILQYLLSSQIETAFEEKGRIAMKMKSFIFKASKKRKETELAQMMRQNS